jgi:signal transduction histidine kinase
MSATVPSADLLLRHAGEALIAVDPATLKILRATPGAAQWLRHDGDLHGRLITDFDISLPSAVYWNEAAAGAREPLDRVETQYRRADGSVVDVTQSVLAAEEDGCEYLVVRAAEARRESLSDQAAADYATQLRTILEAAAEGILVLDTAEQVVSINHRLAALWSLPPHIVARGDGTQILAVMAGQLAGQPDAQTRLQTLLQRPRAPLFQTLTLNNGRTLEKRAQPHLVDGQTLGTILTFIDVTDRVRAERTLKSDRDFLVDLVAGQIADLRRARDEAEEASRAKSDFLATISHELRTPMHAILSFAAFGERGYATSKAETLLHYFNHISQAGDRLLGLINDLLDLSKSRAGKLSVEPDVQDIRPLIDEAARELSALARAKDINLECRLGETAAPAGVDGSRLGQVVRNLLSNAIKFTPQGGHISLSLSHTADAQGRGWHRLEVSDNGEGIPEDELDLIFEQFEQGNGGAAAGGTGLGLAIARELMHAHGGSISAANNPDRGATFTVLLPAQDAARETRRPVELVTRA